MDFSIIRRAGLTQGQFAELAGVSRITVNTWVQGKFRPRPPQRTRVIRAVQLLEAAVRKQHLPLSADNRHSAILDAFREALDVSEA